MEYVLIGLIVLLILIIISNIKVVPQAQAYIIERLGAYKETWEVGLHLRFPCLTKLLTGFRLRKRY